MEGEDPMSVFDGAGDVAAVSLSRVVEWFESTGPTRLVLPSIQRSLVWRNSQIIDLWDSLLRGFPIGLLMVVKAASGSGIRDINNATTTATGGEYTLFDGQQRLAAFMLGKGAGPLRATRQLWVDVSRESGPGDNLFTLRISSTGQPYGYRVDKPDAKLSSETLREQYLQWPKKDGFLQSAEAVFHAISKQATSKLGGGGFSVPLQLLTQAECIESKLKALMSEANIPPQQFNPAKFADCLGRALSAKVLLSSVDSSLLTDSNYSLLFARLGQNGTRLSDDELTYSLIKQKFPYVHDRVSEITERSGAPGRFASSIDLVLGAFRIARTQTLEATLAPGTSDRARTANIQTLVRRPFSRDVTGLALSAAVETAFLQMLPNEHSSPRILLETVIALRQSLVWKDGEHDTGLPLILLARLPRDLLDVLLLLTIKNTENGTVVGEKQSALVAFTLFWLIFVADDEKAAELVFLRSIDAGWTPDPHSLARLLAELQEVGLARTAPHLGDWDELLEEANGEISLTRTWESRFIASDTEARKPGLSLRVLSTHRELIKRMLLWLQRDYIQKRFYNFDPLSTRDEDLPLDLDHIIPGNRFLKGNLNGSDIEWDDKRKRAHEVHCNSLGNYRWLAAVDNRSRQANPLEAEGEIEHLRDYVDRDIINQFIRTTWQADTIRAVYSSVNSRSVRLCRIFMRESGIDALLLLADSRSEPQEAES